MGRSIDMVERNNNTWNQLSSTNWYLFYMQVSCFGPSTQEVYLSAVWIIVKGSIVTWWKTEAQFITRTETQHIWVYLCDSLPTWLKKKSYNFSVIQFPSYRKMAVPFYLVDSNTLKRKVTCYRHLCSAWDKQVLLNTAIISSINCFYVCFSS